MSPQSILSLTLMPNKETPFIKNVLEEIVFLDIISSSFWLFKFFVTGIIAAIKIVFHIPNDADRTGIQ